MTDETPTNVYEGEPDARQLDADAIPDDCKLFRKRYRALTPDEIALHDAIKDKADELAALIAQVKPPIAAPIPPVAFVAGQSATARAIVERLHMLSYNQGANVTLALRHLEDAVYRAVKALTA